MSEPQIDPDTLSPWIMCPECGGTWFRMTANLERGRWTNDGQYVLRDLPHPGAWVMGEDHPFTCCDCGTNIESFEFRGAE